MLFIAIDFYADRYLVTGYLNETSFHMELERCYTAYAYYTLRKIGDDGGVVVQYLEGSHPSRYDDALGFVFVESFFRRNNRYTHDYTI